MAETNVKPEGEKAVPEGRRPSVGFKKSAFIVNMVNPRFQNYNRPLLLALMVGLLTSLLMVCTCVLVMSGKPKMT